MKDVIIKNGDSYMIQPTEYKEITKDGKTYKVPKKIVEDMQLASMHSSAAFLLLSLAMNHIDKTEEMEKKYGFYKQEIKSLYNIINSKFDRLKTLMYQEMYKYNPTEGASGKDAYDSDYINTIGAINKYLGFDEDGEYFLHEIK